MSEAVETTVEEQDVDLTGANEELLGEADLILSLDVFDLFQSLTTVDFLDRTTKYIINPVCVCCKCCFLVH